ncbi:Superfamily II DNA or RNA helicase [Dehalogenimonas formicexedens]|uniref:Superfamily II DNA or RNA helicase n=1 Tax=Dehalogenimonas formicexedens TaxID=1839801 RepID=A0A1P8F5B5_9CHLR|nr:DEAD/DEAH box helicase family protein [Dehalogenimonas formicexedens]APV43671.1 Superfamily II DNA or RNA helicase [Dehalogenimonas formicexedens]
MSFEDILIKKEYRSLLDDISNEFYIPLLSAATLYQRAVGFFSSSALVEVSKGISGLVRNGGKIQLVASPYLSDEDICAIRKGYEIREQIVKQAVLRELQNARNDYELERLNILAHLIANDTLDIKIAFVEDANNTGIYHEKMGIFTDALGNKVAFSGSMNESVSGIKVNYEAIDVFCSWREPDRVLAKERAFISIWNDCEPNVRIIPFPELKREIIERYKKYPPNFDAEQLELNGFVDSQKRSKMKCLGVVIPHKVELHDYQKMAIDEWEKRGYKGIFDMATGTGKTYTGLGALARLSQAVSGNLAIFIVCPYQHLVEQWVEDLLQFNVDPIIGYSASSQKDWKSRLDNAIRDQKIKVNNKEFFCFICTNATFASDFVQKQVQRIRSNAVLLVDEAHNFGATALSQLLSEIFPFRLALSATFERHRDIEGTSALYSYFGEKCIEYPIERAIQEKKLTNYKYYPVITALSEGELNKYSELTYEIGKCVVKGKDGKTTLSERGKMLTLARARLVAGAENKITQLGYCISPYIHDNHILVYCGATKILAENQDSTPVDDEDLRQIDVVTDLLGNKLNMNVSQFTSKEDVEERARLKREFAAGETLQALIAIKCLDEGVNIPNIKIAFILASTTNPKEYIQRRGRVLRLAEGKDHAEIFDFITLPRALDQVPSLTQAQVNRDLALVKSETKRAEDFASIAMNMIEAQSIIDSIKSVYRIQDKEYGYEEELTYE